MESNPVEQQRSLRRGSRQVVVEDSRSAPENGPGIAVRHQRKREPRREVVVGHRRLPVVANAKCQRELPPQDNLILYESARLVHVECRARIATIDAKYQRMARGKLRQARKLERASEVRSIDGIDLIGVESPTEQQSVTGETVIVDGILEIDAPSLIPGERLRRPRRERLFHDNRRGSRRVAAAFVLLRETDNQVVAPAGRK